MYLGKTGNVLCLVASILEYLIRGNHPGPVFVLQDSRPLSNLMLVEKVCQPLQPVPNATHTFPPIVHTSHFSSRCKQPFFKFHQFGGVELFIT